MTRFLTLLALVLTAALLARDVDAQGQYRTVASVDGDAVTAFEVDQRTRFLRLVRQPGANEAFALDQLIEDRLKLAAARRAGLELTEEGLQNGLVEFAGRANLELDEFLQVLRAQGIEETTLRDFVRVGLTWRELVRSRFGNRAQIGETEIDRAIGGAGGAGSSVRVLLNEIILPARPGRRNERAQAQREAQRLKNIRSISAFQAEARSKSVAQTRGRSGRLDWLSLAELPPSLTPILLGLSPGEVTEPIELENAILLFQLRDIEEIAVPAAAPAAIDYAALYLPGGRSDRTMNEAARIVERVDTCDDLYGIARDMPREALERGAKTPAEIPQDVAIELAKLDPGETSISLTRANGETLVLLMLCSRVAGLAESPDRDAIRNQLRSQRLAGFADGYLQELRAQAVISRP
ncbi:MAG: peptidylprolyl isomerase [Pseudomonadota bacterium]